MRTNRTASLTPALLLGGIFGLLGVLGCDRGVGQEVALDRQPADSATAQTPPARPAPASTGAAPVGNTGRTGSGFAPGQTLQGYRPLEGYVLELDGEVVKDAQIYNEATPSILLMAQGLPAPVVLWIEARKVESINLLKVSRTAAGGVDILPNPSLEVHNQPLVIDGPEVRFEVSGHQVLLKPKPPLIGLKRAGDLVAYSDAYAQRAEFYQPSAEVLDKLRRGDRQVRVRVYFGTWCPACGQMVPRVIKVAQQLAEAGDTDIDFEFYGLPRQIRSDPEASRDNIQQVPTGVIYVDNREVGRINGVEWRTPESALVALLSS